MFFVFNLSCKKYGFSYSLNAVNDLTLALHPSCALGYIEIKQKYYERNYFKLFLSAISRMRAYSKGREHL